MRRRMVRTKGVSQLPEPCKLRWKLTDDLKNEMLIAGSALDKYEYVKCRNVGLFI